MWCVLKGLTSGVTDAFRPWVHGSVGKDAALAARHLAVISSHVLGGLVAAAVLAGWFLLGGSLGLATAAACLAFLAPLGIAAQLSRTGRLDVAHLLSAAQLAAIVSLTAIMTGGTGSFAIAWLALVPLEAALSGRARITALAAVLAVAIFVALEAAAAAGMLPAPATLPVDAATLTLLANLAAVLYAGAVAGSVVRIQSAARREIEASRERYRLIAENANDLVTRHDSSGRLEFASLASATILGVAADKLVADGFGSVLCADDRDRYAGSITRCLASGQPVAEEYCLTRTSRTGAEETVWVEMRCQPVGPGATGEATVVAVTRDITRAKAEAAELARARDEADRASRAKTAFLATMSHELRTPLSAIIGFSELLHRELLIKAREPRHADYCRTIHQSGEHLLAIVKDLLDVSKIESGNMSVVPEPFELADVARAAVETLRPQALAKEITLASRLDPDLPELMADRRATRQVLINLVANAVKFTPPRGRVTLEARRTGSMVEIAVTDTGIGIPAEHIERLGRPFYQVETSYARQNEGTGLGLSIVRGIVELHGGELRIESEPGKGSRFAVTFPIDDDASATGAASTEPSPQTTDQGGCLVVDLAELHHQRMRRLDAVEGSEADGVSDWIDGEVRPGRLVAAGGR